MQIFQFFPYPILFFAVLVFGTSVKRLPANEEQKKQQTIQIQGYSPTQEDDYVGVALKAEPGYVVEFEPAAHADRVHHMLLYGCTVPAYTDRNFWQDGSTCGSGNHILYAWARNAPSLKLPENVGFAVGNKGDPVQYLVLQIHYAKKFVGEVHDFSGITLHLSQKKPRYLAGVYLFLSGEMIMPGYPAYFTNMSCSYNFDTKLHPFAFRTHTHQMGRVVSSYVKKAKNGKWIQIGKRNPQWPQLFQAREKPLVIEKGDFMAGTCRYDSSDKTEPVPMGSMGKNEMCNFYMMYYQEASEPDPFPYGAGCFGDQDPETVVKEYPKEGTTLLAPHPEWEHQAHQSGKQFGVLERQKVQQLGGEKLGQVAGLAIGPDGRLVIFHRAGRVWDQNTFDSNNALADRRPIQGAVILVAENGADGKLKMVAKYGQNTFFLPHGISVDQNGDFYTTDVGSHQIIKWRVKNEKLEQIWSLGEKFVPGSDQSHFCKPAGIAISRIDGAVFIADGYCNNRIVKLSSEGRFLSQFGQSVSNYNAPLRLGEFSLPHDIALDEAGGRLFVADRENGRVQAFSLANGHKPLYEVKHPALFSSVYSVHYQPSLGLLFVPGTSSYSQSGQAQQIDVYVVQSNFTTVQYSFRPQSDLLHRPHVLRAWGQNVWVGEIDEAGGVLWQLEIQSESAERPAEEGMAGGRNHWGQKGVPAQSLADPLHPGLMLIPEFNSGQFALGLLLFCLAASALCLFLWRCCCCAREQELFDKKGFKPLNNSDVPDEDADFSSSESEIGEGIERLGLDSRNRESGF